MKIRLNQVQVMIKRNENPCEKVKLTHDHLAHNSCLASCFILCNKLTWTINQLSCSITQLTSAGGDGKLLGDLQDKVLDIERKLNSFDNLVSDDAKVFFFSIKFCCGNGGGNLRIGGF